MLIGTYQALKKIRNINVQIDSEPINRVSVAKYVVMYIDENLKWDVDIDKIIPKILAKISVLRCLRKLVQIDTLTLMCNAIVLPHFDYADIVLDSASVTSKCKLQSLQIRAAKLLNGSGPRTSRNPMYKSLTWLSLQHRQDFHECVMVYKCCNSLAPSYLEQLYTSNDTKHTYNTRHSSQLPKPEHHFTIVLMIFLQKHDANAAAKYCLGFRLTGNTRLGLVTVCTVVNSHVVTSLSCN